MSEQVLNGRMEIISALRQIARAGVTLAAHVQDDGLPAFATRLLAVNPDYEELVFDCFADAQANRRAVEANEVGFRCMLEGVEMHFLACSGEATIYAGHPALRMRLPARVLRLQRREYFRVPAALPCEVVLDAHDRVQVLEMRTADLSMSGVTLLTDKALELEIGQLFERCHLPMGEHGELSAALEVRNLSGIRTRGGAPRLRVGCSFLALPPALEVSLARFIGKLERSSRR